MPSASRLLQLLQTTSLSLAHAEVDYCRVGSGVVIVPRWLETIRAVHCLAETNGLYLRFVFVVPSKIGLVIMSTFLDKCLLLMYVRDSA